MKKYYYNLDGKKGCYTLTEIASVLKINDTFLEELLKQSNDDIDLACIKGYKEVTSKAKLKEVVDLYTYKYLCSKNINEIMQEELEFRNKKRKLLNILDCLFNQDDKICISLDREAIDLLMINTTDDLNKEVMNMEQTNVFRSLHNFSNTNDKGFYKLDIEDENTIYIDYFNTNDYKEIKDGKVPNFNISNGTDVYNINIKDLKKVVNYLSTHKLPMMLNTLVTCDLSNSLKGNKSTVIEYVKK